MAMTNHMKLSQALKKNHLPGCADGNGWLFKGEKFNWKRNVSKKETTERYNYEPYKTSRGNAKYKLEVDFQDGLVIKFQDL